VTAKHNLTIYLVLCGLKLQDIPNHAMWLRANNLASCKSETNFGRNYRPYMELFDWFM